MRGSWKLSLLVAALYGSQCLVNSNPLAADSLTATAALQVRDDGPELIGPPKDYDKLADKGKKVDNELLKAIKENHKDVKLKPLSDNYEEYAEPSKSMSSAKDLEENFKEIGFNFENVKCRSDRVYSKAGPASKRIVVGGNYCDQNGVIVGEERFAENDENPKDKKMKSSDIVFLIWKKFAGHRDKNGNVDKGMTDDVNKFMNIIGRNILSRSTVETMAKAQEKTHQPSDHVGHFRRDSVNTELEAFYALLGTDSVSSYNYMLKDHHEALGNKRISEIFTYPRTWDSGKNKDGRQKRSMVMKLEVYKPK